MASALSQELSLQNKKIFDQMSNAFDQRQYDKAIKYGDQILATHPGHGETIAMKGLILHTQEKREEGMKVVREGLMKNLKSSVSWHCLGLVQKADKNHAEAVKAFKRSVILDERNINAARDLSSSAIQCRDWAQFVEVRQMMLGHKPNVRANWVGLACAHHMNGNPELALAVMDIMVAIMEAGSNTFETSEAHVFRAELELSAGRPSNALEVLRKHDAEIADAPVKCLLRAKAHAALGEAEEAEKLFLESIAGGNSEVDSIDALSALSGIVVDKTTHLPVHHNNRADAKVVEQCDKFVALLDKIAAAAPRCDAAKRFALDVCSTEEFEGRLKAYIKPYIIKMIPSVTFILKSLYNYFPATDSRITMIGTVLHAMEASLEKNDYDAFFSTFATAGASQPTGDRNPALLLWVYQFLAAHYLRIRNYTKAHEYADKAINHTPTIEMLYLLKAKIFSREGDLAKAAELADTARVLDLQDKYLNAKAAKYFFRIGDVEKAEGNMKLFMKDDEDPAATYLTALDSQTAWYEREVGDAFMIRKDYISALQNYAMFEKHHKDNHDEMVDFHNYTFRRSTMRQWIDVQQNDIQIGLQRFFLLTCPRMVKVYMAIAKEGEEACRAAHVPRPAPLPMSAAAKKDKEKEAEEKHRQKQYKELYLKDIDISEPLAKARRYVDALLHYRPNEVTSHTTAINYFLTLETVPTLLIAYSLSMLKKISKEDGTGIEGVSITVGERAKAATELAALKKAFEEKYATVKASTDARVVSAVDAILKQL